MSEVAHAVALSVAMEAVRLPLRGRGIAPFVRAGPLFVVRVPWRVA